MLAPRWAAPWPRFVRDDGDGGVRGCAAHPRAATPTDLCASHRALFKFIVDQMTYEFRRLFVVGFGGADSAQDRKEQ